MSEDPEKIGWGGPFVAEGSHEALTQLYETRDGDAHGAQLVWEVVEQRVVVEGRVSVLPFDIGSPAPHHPGRPLELLENAATVALDHEGPAVLRTVSSVFPEGHEEGEGDVDLVVAGDFGLWLASVSWGEVASWQPARSGRREVSPVPAATGLLLTTAPPGRVVPSAAPARRWAVRGPWGYRPSRSARMPWMAGVDGSDQAASRALPELLDSVATWGSSRAQGSARSGAPFIDYPGASLRTLEEDGADVILLAGAASRISGVREDVLLMWEGRDRSGATVAVAVQRERMLD